jgi:hypothetical protein
MNETSIESYHKLDQHKTESERQKILTFLQKWRPLVFSDSQIAEATGLAVNVVESRRNDLLKRGDIVNAGIIFNHTTNRNVQGWKAKT